MTETLVFAVPTELKDVVTNVVNQILKIKTDPPYAAANPDETTGAQRTAETPVFVKPSREEVCLYLENRRSPVNAQRFYTWMEKHDWHDGNGEPITDWKAKVADWEAREPQRMPQTKVQKMNSQITKHSDAPKKDDTERLLRILNMENKEAAQPE